MRLLWLGTCGILVLPIAAARAQTEPQETAELDTQSAVEESPAGETLDVEAEVDAAGPAVDPAREEEARGRFTLGQTLYEQGRFEEAADQFRRAHQASGRPQLLYNVYLAERDNGNVAGAEAALSAYLSQVEEIPNRALLAQRLASLREQLTAQTAQEQQVQEARRTEEQARATLDAAARAPNRMGPVMLFATGGASLIAAGALALNVRSIASDLDAQCFDSFCPPSAHAQIDQQNRRAISVDVLLGAGVLLLASGGLWWALQKPVEVPPVEAVCGPSGCAVRGTF